MALRRLQQHEQDTLRVTSFGLQVEIHSMTAMLREVLAATMRSEGRLHDATASKDVASSPLGRHQAPHEHSAATVVGVAGSSRTVWSSRAV